jgi:anti-sigma regulatory factor (Ser/Thr protein kinase)
MGLARERLGRAVAMPEIALAAARDSPRLAREFVRRHLRDWGCAGSSDLLGTVDLMTSELVTNAVVHVGQPFTVRVSRSRERLRVEVSDPGPAEPVLAHGGWAHPERDGLGLRYVANLATCWGVDATLDGKAVWFEVQADA